MKIQRMTKDTLHYTVFDYASQIHKGTTTHVNQCITKSWNIKGAQRMV